MDRKVIGLIAVIVLAVGVLAYTFKANFLTGPVRDNNADAAKMKAAMEQARDNAIRGGVRGGSSRTATTPASK